MAFTGYVPGQDAPPPPDDNAPFSDTAKSLAGSVTDLGAQAAGGIAALQRQAGNPAAEHMQDVQDRLNEASHVVRDSMSTTGKKVAAADWTSAEGLRTKLSHPIQAASMSAAEMAPMLLSAVGLPGGWAGVAAGSTLFGTQGVLQQMNSNRDRVMSTPDDQLQTQMPLYKALRQDYDEPEARQRLVDAANDARGLLIAGGANAIAGGALGHILHGPATSGFLKSMGIGALENAGAMAAQSGGMEAAQEKSQIATGERSDMDPEAIALQALNGSVTGTVLGGTLGAVRGVSLPRKVKAPAVDKDVQTGRTVNNGQPDPAQTAALDTALNDTNTQPPAGVVPATTPPAEGTLADQIAKEQAKAQPAAGAPASSPAAPTAAPVEPTPSVQTAPKEPPAALPTPTAGAAQSTPELPIPLPTYRTGLVKENMPPRPIERTAVPLEDPDRAQLADVPAAQPTSAPVTEAEALALTANLPKKPAAQEPVPVAAREAEAAPVPEPTSPPAREPGPVQPEPHITELNEAVANHVPEKPAESFVEEPTELPKEETAPKEPAKVTPPELAPAELVSTTGEGRKVFAVKNEVTELAKQARAEAAARENKRLSEAERGRERRFNAQGENEKKAAEVVKASHPTDADELETLHAMEQRATSGGAGQEAAREIIRGRAMDTLNAAENRGIRIGERTRPTVEQGEAGEKNPTPYTTRLQEIKKFLQLEKIARLSKNTTKLDELYKTHVDTERAMRAGDLSGAAERRLEANEKLNTRHRQGRVKAEAQRTAEEQAELDRLVREQHEESEIRVGKADHYAVTGKEGVRHADAADEVLHLASEFHPRNFTNPAHKARAALLQAFARRIAERVRGTPMHFVADAAKKAELGFTDGGRRGVFTFLRTGATKEGIRGEIYIDNDIIHDPRGPQVILHEATHAATTHAIRHNIRLRADINTVRQEALDAWERKNSREPVPSWTEVATGGESEPRPYGFHNEEEFMAEALADPRLRSHLIETPASRELVEHLGLNKGASLWRSLVAAVTRAMGLGEKHYTLMDAALHLGDEAMKYEPPRDSTMSLSDVRRGTNRTHIAEAEHRFVTGARTAEDLKQMVKDAPHLSESLRSKVRGLGIKLATMHNLANMADSNNLFGEGNPVRKLFASAKKMSHMKEEILRSSGADKLVQRLAALERKSTPERMQEFGELLRDETMAGVYADKPLDQQKGVTSQGKAMHRGLASRYAALTSEEKALRRDMHSYFRKQQNEASLATIKAVIRAINPNGEADDALATKIHENSLSDAEKAVLDRHHVMRALRNAKAMQKVNGPYVPLMRHGEHVVSGNYDVAAPKGATRLNEEGAKDAKGNVYQFDTKEDAQRFAENAPVKVLREQAVYTDPTTGERFAVDPATGEKDRLTKEDWAANEADRKFRVTLQPKHVEFFESETEARRRHAELSNHDFGAGTKLTMDGVAPRRYEPTGKNATFMSLEWDRALNSLRQRGGFKALDDHAKRELENHLIELSLSSLGSTRAQSRRLPRTFVQGASSDIQKSLGHYASAMSGFLSRQRYAPDVDAAMKSMTDYQESHRYEGSERTYPRGQILKELQQRLYASGEPERADLLSRGTRRLMQMSQMDKLASPAFHVINSMEPWTTSMPVIGGKYGMGRAVMALHRAYADIGAPTILGKGLVDTAKAFRSNEGLTDYISTLKDRVASKKYGKEFADVLQEMGELGVISRDAGMEVGRLSDPSARMVFRGLDRADVMARQMGTAVESINRFVTARAEYLLAREDGLSHEQAKQAAIDRTIDTMGDYSSFNAAPIFNHPVGRLALQFKKFAQKTYYILGKTALEAFRGDTGSMKAFAGLMATHGLLAGALGLPLEAIHAGMLAAQLTGITSSNYGDFEQWMRGVAARNLGTGFGEIATRGLPRYMGVDVSSRFSLADLVFPLGDPQSLKQNDLLAYAAKAFGGAPLSLLAEYPHGVQALLSGDLVEASRVLVPLKFYSDSVTAYQRASVGRQTASGKEKMSPYTPGEAFTRSMGFAPAREAETMEAYGAQYGDQQAFKKQRGALLNGWVSAKPDDKAAQWRKIIEWNAGQPPAARISIGEAHRAATRRLHEDRALNTKGGLRTGKRDAFVRDQAAYYNP